MFFFHLPVPCKLSWWAQSRGTHARVASNRVEITLLAKGSDRCGLLGFEPRCCLLDSILRALPLLYQSRQVIASVISLNDLVKTGQHSTISVSGGLSHARLRLLSVAESLSHFNFFLLVFLWYCFKRLLR